MGRSRGHTAQKGVLEDGRRLGDGGAAVRSLLQGEGRLNALQLNHEFLEEGRWLELLADISDRDDLNTRCSGFAMAILGRRLAK